MRLEKLLYLPLFLSSIFCFFSLSPPLSSPDFSPSLSSLSTQVISQNPQAFIDLLNSPQPGPAGQAAGQAGGGAAGQGAPPQGGAPFGMPMTIQVTPQEKEAIERVSIECGLTLSLSHSHHHTVTPSHYHSLSLSHCHHHTTTITLSHHHTITITLSYHHTTRP